MQIGEIVKIKEKVYKDAGLNHLKSFVFFIVGFVKSKIIVEVMEHKRFTIRHRLYSYNSPYNLIADVKMKFKKDEVVRSEYTFKSEVLEVLR